MPLPLIAYGVNTYSCCEQIVWFGFMLLWRQVHNASFLDFPPLEKLKNLAASVQFSGVGGLSRREEMTILSTCCSWVISAVAIPTASMEYELPVVDRLCIAHLHCLLAAFMTSWYT